MNHIASAFSMAVSLWVRGRLSVLKRPIRQRAFGVPRLTARQPSDIATLSIVRRGGIVSAGTARQE
jgi:hypothetical protein